MSVDVAKVKYRRPLNKDQKWILSWLYLFRFSTVKQMADKLGKSSPKALQKRLQILEEQGFIGKRYDKSYKLAGRPAEYYLTPKGAKQTKDPDELVIKALYKNKTVSDSFVKHCLNVVDVALKLLAIHSGQVRILTKYSLVGFDGYPDWKPDLMLRIRKSGGEAYAFLDVWDDTKPFFVMVRKARNYLAWLEDGGLPADTYDSDPAILFVCDSQKGQGKLNRQIKKALYEEDVDNQIFATTNQQELTEATKPTQKIWQALDPDERPERVSLTSLI